MDADAIVLAGGRAARFGGADKLALPDQGGVAVLDRVLAAVAGSRHVVVVGPPAGRAGVVEVREEPPFGGPVAALAAALPHVSAPWVLLLAGDQPRVAPGVAALLAEADEADEADDGIDGVLLVDAEGRRQWLAGCYRATALRTAVAAGAVEGASLRGALGGLTLAEVPDVWGAADDVDTPDDAARLLGPE